MSRPLGRALGWPLAAFYLVATAVFLPAVSEVLNGKTPEFSVPWIPQLGVEFALRADGLGVVFTLIALVIGAVVFVYSTKYLEEGPQLSFYLVMATFTLAMVGLVLANDLVLLFICWELTSLASFLLIARSGVGGEAPSMRTLLITFIGGLLLLAAVALMIGKIGTGNVHEVLTSSVWRDDPAFTGLVAALVALAACTKSAQFPFHVWLPDAMAAATPVSAYLHAAAVV
ncbi:proton-conducting transporter transmembrane domain-containing protein, partial [Dermabacteraceae bacterium P13101]